MILAKIYGKPCNGTAVSEALICMNATDYEAIFWFHEIVIANLDLFVMAR